jgi:hypothetical protein
MGKLTKQNGKDIQALIDARVFKKVTRASIKSRKQDGGEIAIMCADGAQLVDKIAHRILSTVDKERMIKNTGIILESVIRRSQNDDEATMIAKMSEAVTEGYFKTTKRLSRSVMFHVLTANGGPLLIPEKSPLNINNARNFLMNQIREAIKIKNVKNIVLYTHAPCGAAGLVGLFIEEQVQLLMDAEKELVQRFPDITVTRYFHVDYSSQPQPGHKSKETYFVSKENWEKLKK